MVKAIVVDSTGNIYSTGSFSGTVDFDPGSDTYFMTGVAGADMFIQKNASDGSLIWAKSIVGTGSVSGKNILIDVYGDIIISASFSGSILNDEFPDSIIISNSATSTAVFKYNNLGEFTWAYTTSGETAAPASMATDQLGNTIVVGSFKGGSVDFNPGPGGALTNLGTGYEDDGYVVKIDENGDYLWVDGIGGTHTDRNYGVTIDLQNNIYVCGTFSYTAYFGPSNDSTLDSPQSFESYVMKYTSSGQFDWIRASEGGHNSYAGSITIDINGDLCIVGFFSGTTDFDPGIEVNELSAIGYTDVFIQKLTSSGDFLWAKSFGGQSSFNASAGQFISTDLSGYIYTYGVFKDTVDFDPSPAVLNLTTIGLNDIFVQKLNGDGDFIWARSFGGLQNDASGNIYVDQHFNIFLTGAFYDTCSLDINTIAFTDTSNGLSDGFIMKIDQDSCATFITLTDSISMPDCVESGYISVSAFNGVEPYEYEWNISLLDTNSLHVDTGGVITVTITDVNSCSKTTSYLFNTPPPPSNFDLDVNLITSEFRPGFSSDVTIDALNYGCIETSGQLIIVLDTLLVLDSSDVVPNEIIGDSLVWNFDDLSFGTDHIIRHLVLTTSSLAIIGDTVCLDLIISPINGDLDSTNNSKHYCYEVVNGYDPNDKQVYPQGICTANYVLKHDDLSYTIQFQNTGNSEAINIHIIDSLSPFLNINTVEVISSSHSMITEVRPGNVLDFIFDDIQLIDSATGGALSQGYVIFKVTPFDSVENGAIVLNKSEIYFDFNPAIITNTVYNTLIDELNSCDVLLTTEEEVLNNEWISIYPNPGQGLFTIDFSNEKEASIMIYAINGQVIYKQDHIRSKNHSFNIDGPPGVYILRVIMEDKSQFYKIIKQ